jgi:hypothetical protein
MSLSKNTTSFIEYFTRAMAFYAEHFLALVNLSFACIAPTIFKTILDGTGDPGGSLIGLLLAPVIFCVYTFFSMCLTYQTVSMAMGQGLTVKDVMAHVAARFLKGVGGHLLLSLVVIVGSILLILPGIYCFVIFYFFIFGILLEDKGVFASFKRSHELAHHRFWRVLAAHALVFLLMILLFMSLIIGMKMMGADNLITMVLTGVVAALTMPVFVAFYYFVYADIKAEYDGVLNIVVKG